MRRNKISISLVIISLILLNSCGFKRMKYAATGTGSFAYSINQIGYKQVSDLVLTQNCVKCHNQSLHDGSIVLDSYAAVKANLGLVQSEVASRSMPPDNTLQADQIQLISEWVSNGAPEVGSQAPSTSPTPIAGGPTPTPAPPSVLVATYASIRENVFVPKCLSCHSAGASQSKRPLDNYANMMANTSLISAGDPANSGVYTEIDGGTMPPNNRNQVTAEEEAVIKTWIQNGALNN